MKIFLSFYSFLLLPALALAQPVDFQWAKQIGSNRSDYVIETAIDKAGNIYMVGTFQGTVDMDPGPGSFEITASGGIDIYISKLDARGNFLWVKQIGNDDAASNEGVRDIGIDALGNIYITGSFGNTADFDPNAGVFEMTATGPEAAYLSKLDPNGNFIWAKTIAQSTNISDGIATKVSAAGNIYVMGSFLGEADLDPGPGVLNVPAPADAIFISKFDNAGNLIWSRQFFSTLGVSHRCN